MGRPREHYADILHEPLRPLFVGEHSAFDAYRIFCDYLADRNDPDPNIAVVHLTDSRDCSRLSLQLLRDERERNIRDLPVLVLSPTGRLSLEKPITTRRPCQLMRTPVSALRFVEALNMLLSAPEQSHRSSAA